VVDAKVLSGNMDDKTYNQENIEDVDKLLAKMHVDRSDFYYIADSAFFTKEAIKNAHDKGIKFITRVPDNFTIAKKQLEIPLPENAKTVIIENAHNKEVKYRLTEVKSEYEGYPCNLAVVFSYSQEKIKRKSCQKKIQKELASLIEKLKEYEKRRFVCIEDAAKEIESLTEKELTKVKFHTVDLTISEHEKRKRGRPSKNPENDIIKEYKVDYKIQEDETKVEDSIRQESTFILSSNDLELTGEQMLREYKTQSDVEKTFQKLKSPTFMSSLFLKTPERVEAVVYLLLIGLMILSIAQRVVRKELKKRGDVVYGPEKRKQKQPTFTTILRIMDRISVTIYTFSNGVVIRKIRTIDESCKKIIEILKIPLSNFAWNGSG
jgi:transposase